MAKNNQYINGYKMGYRAGYIEGTKEPSEKVINEDIRFIYGGVCLALKELFGFGTKRLYDVMLKTQEIWNGESADYEKWVNEGMPDNREKFMDRVNRVTGIDIVQIFNLGEVDE